MNKETLIRKVEEFSKQEPWNHNYSFPNDIETCTNLSDSPRNNLIKWNRLEKLFSKHAIKNKSVIDIGCSDGFYSIECAKLGASNVLGVDADSLRIERANFASEVLKINNVSFKNLDIYGDDLKGTHFDVVLALGILHRIPDIYGFLKRLSELGNTIVLEFKTYDSEEAVCKWGGAKTKGNKFNNLYFLPSIKMIKNILEHLGFEVSDIQKDESNLKYKRTIMVANKIEKIENRVFEEYKDKHKGERVFLIGNGPSLADTDLNLLKDENTIAMNRISMIYDKNKEWKPTYYLFSSTNVKDEIWGEAWLSSVHNSISEDKTTSFIASIFKQYIDPDDKFPSVKWFDSLSETRPDITGNIVEESFSTDIIDRIDKTGTTMNLALQIAYHMGFSEIVFVGADLGWTKDLGSKSDPNHFDKNYRANIGNPYKANHQMRNVHKLALSIFKKNKSDVKIYNASNKTVLDVYPIIEYDTYVHKQEVVLRENDMKIAKEYWNNLVFTPPKKESIILRGLRKIKRTIMRSS